MGFRIERFATDSVIEKEGIGIGDEIFITGLFGYHPGAKKNIPIVRIGHIAAIPEEPIKTEFSGKFGTGKGMDVAC